MTASSVVHALPHLFSSLEIGDVLSRNLNLFTRLRIAPNPWLPVAQAEAAETAYLNAAVGNHTACNGLKNRVDHELGIVVSKRWNTGMQPVNQFGSGHELKNRQMIWLTAKPLAFAFFASVSSAVAIPLAPASNAIARCKASPERKPLAACRAIPAASANAFRLTGNNRNPDLQKASKSFHAACACLALISPLRTLMDKAHENSVTIQSDDTKGSVQDSNQASIAGLAGSGTNNGTAALVSR
jgi:hypothetical protein